MHRFSLILLFGILTAVLFIAVCPAFEMNREEARIYIAHNSAREIAMSDVNARSKLLEETDPWGEPYRIIQLPEGLAAMSCGPNRTSPPAGFDGDDIHSDMQARSLHQDKDRRLLFAFSLPVVLIFGSITYLLAGYLRSDVQLRD